MVGDILGVTVGIDEVGCTVGTSVGVLLGFEVFGESEGLREG